MKQLLWIVLLSISLYADKVYAKKDIRVDNNITTDKVTNQPINGVIRIYDHKGGVLIFETPYKNGKRDGVYKSFWSAGIPMENIPYKNGKIVGTKRFFYPTGELQTEIPRENEKKEYATKEYYKSGDLKKEVKYKNNKAIEGYKYTTYGQKTKMTNAHIYNINIKREKFKKEWKQKQKSLKN